MKHTIARRFEFWISVVSFDRIESAVVVIIIVKLTITLKGCCYSMQEYIRTYSTHYWVYSHVYEYAINYLICNELIRHFKISGAWWNDTVFNKISVHFYFLIRSSSSSKEETYYNRNTKNQIKRQLIVHQRKMKHDQRKKKWKERKRRLNFT